MRATRPRTRVRQGPATAESRSDARNLSASARVAGDARLCRIDYALRHGADIVVNTDGDNQYPQERIADLVQPIIAREADMLVGIFE